MQRGRANRRASSHLESGIDSSHTHLHSYEQFGRVEILEGGLAGSPFVEVSSLANLAQQQLDSGYPENAAYLLRAAEHITFAALAPKHSSALSPRIPVELRDTAEGELNRLIQIAEANWSASSGNRQVIETIFTSALSQARVVFACGAYRPALQLARAGEILSRISTGLPSTMPVDRELKR